MASKWRLTVDYPAYAKLAEAGWESYRQDFGKYGLPYFPNVSMGWDSSPRTVQSDIHANLGYPFTPILVDNTPEQFRKSLAAVKEFLDRSGTLPPIVTINSWNEWTEGSYIEPDTVHGLGYLEAIRSVFGG
ncbi:glycoside hydrolase family 99-like domain-containing protein [Paenibacillus sp. PAMC21692]|uniref:glycoside hydrolase family 99-like domain-containing protein n=1 Tax=Paenibacillus sp. PAMC21692 TaxID=2762320 RepID=UPI0037C8C631